MKTSRAALVLSCTAAVLLTACGPEPQQAPEEISGGPAGQVEDMAVTAPDPTGEQLSHEELRSALESHTSGDITDTDDYWEHQRELNTELQRLSVDPPQCKHHVVSSALPVPTSALAAFAVAETTETHAYTFPDASAAQGHLRNEEQGLGSCSEYTVTRDVDGQQTDSTTQIEEVELHTGAEQGIALQREVQTEGSEYAVAVMLRQGAQIVAVIAEQEASLSDEEAADVVVDLQVQAAAILSELTGEEITVPEPEDDEENDDDADAADDTDTDSEDGSDEDSQADGDTNTEDESDSDEPADDDADAAE
ncbi:hypothetical protein [Nesterenkonia alba]|uniref:hypothetical protein n=1 Tax=Nesterenkonia alba TaxID=515814 RepID=UPI0012EB1C6A|nr:hypothetical protein [Nesterenkonia alba]